ncbi:MAG: type II toxin-antitoxin system prevent-host-death family antitoxin [Caulobacter sp.]|nr:type II toxin-antitoxin system prevent-host-death family antitoxin [Caulobacter sp.]
MNIVTAKARLSELVARAEAGEEVILSRNGKAVARIVPIPRRPEGPRALGLWSHLGPMTDPDMFLRSCAELAAGEEILPRK